MWPVHTWLPDAHVEAPTGGSVVLAAIMLKMGGYGFLRFSLPIAPDASRELDWLIIALSLIAVVYIGFVAIAQRDMKKLIAYSSIAHMGFVTLGAFIGFQIVAHTGRTRGIEFGLDGAVVQMLSHGLVSGALFLCVGVMYDRVHSREISAYGGVVNTMPKFAAFMVLFAMANAGVPGTSGFVGEFLVILASFKANVWYAFLAGTTLVLGAAYTLWLVKRVIFGDIANDHVRELKDLNGREFLVLGSWRLRCFWSACGRRRCSMSCAPRRSIWRSSSWSRRSSLEVVRYERFQRRGIQCRPSLGHARDLPGAGGVRDSLARSLLSDARRAWTGGLAIASLIVTAVLWRCSRCPSGSALGGLFELDRMAQVLKVVTLLSVAVVFVYSTDYLKRRAILKGEYYVLGLFATWAPWR